MVWDIGRDDDFLIATSGIGDDSHRDPVTKLQWVVDSESKGQRYHVCHSIGSLFIFFLPYVSFLLFASSLEIHVDTAYHFCILSFISAAIVFSTIHVFILDFKFMLYLYYLCLFELYGGHNCCILRAWCTSLDVFITYLHVLICSR